MDNNLITTQEEIRKIKKPRLQLQATDKEGLSVGMRITGKSYSVRTDRHRCFFPDEWNKFYNSLRENNKIIFDVLINTGARIDEALHIRPKDFDWERNNLTLYVTKTKHVKGEYKGRPRSFVINPQFSRRVKKYIEEKQIASEESLFLDKKTNKILTTQAVYQLLRRMLIKIGIKDYYNFSLHNIRKTHGNWLKALDIQSDEICLRLGHDHDTFLKHYGSASIYNQQDKILMLKILGKIYGL